MSLPLRHPDESRGSSKFTQCRRRYSRGENLWLEFRRADAPARAKSSIKIEPQRLLLLFRQTLSHDPMGSPQIILELSVREAGLGVMLDPFHAARGKIRC